MTPTRFRHPFLCIILLSIFASIGHAKDVKGVAKDDAIKLTGDATQGGMMFGKVAPGTQVFLNKKPVRVTPQGDFVIGFGRDAKPSAQLKVRHPDGSTSQQTLTIKQREYAIQKIEGVPQKTVTPPKSVLKRTRKETRQVVAARKTNSDLTYFLQPYSWPLSGPLTGFYGSQRYYNGVPKRPHYGLDIAAPNGTPVVAPNDGTITLAHPDMYYSGGTLIMDHGYGISSTFIHLSKVLVKVGEKVKRGQVIAEVGSGGRSTGPHLDWRINWYKVRLDPQLVMEGIPMPNRASQP